jgi:hypothetical protein
MDTTFLSYLLVFALICVLILYLYQILPLQQNKKRNGNSNSKGEAFFPVIFDTCNVGRTSGMPVHRVGPVINFHQSFNKYNPAIQHRYKTGIPEMGWRNYYLKNFNENQVPQQDPFAGTPIRNFLNNLDNVDNIYRKCL